MLKKVLSMKDKASTKSLVTTQQQFQQIIAIPSARWKKDASSGAIFNMMILGMLGTLGDAMEGVLFTTYPHIQ